MSENENLNTEEILGMSETEVNEAEELPMEDKKKAINLQDLVYVKKYIDDNHYDCEEVDALLKNKVVEEVAAEVREITYPKEEIYNKTETYSKTEIDENHYTKEATDETFYKKNETVDKALDAEKVNGLEIAQDENGILKNGDVVIPHEKILWSSDKGVTISSAWEKEYAEISGLAFTNGDIIEIEYELTGSGFVKSNSTTYFQFKFDISEGMGATRLIDMPVCIGTTSCTVQLTYHDNTTLRIYKPYKINVDNTPAAAITVYAIRKIIK